MIPNRIERSYFTRDGQKWCAQISDFDVTSEDPESSWLDDSQLGDDP